MALTVSSFIPTGAAVQTRATEQLAFTFNPIPQALSVYVRFVELGTVLLATETRLLAITASPLAAAALRLDVNTNKYRFRYLNANNVAGQSTMTTAPSVGDMVELLGTMSATGVIQLSQSINRATTTAATASSATVISQSWSGATLHLGGVGTANPGTVAILEVVVVRGVQDMSTMRRLAGVS